MYQNCCKKCGSISLHTEVKGNNTGLYCDDCGAWQRWLGKDELRAFEYSQKSRLPKTSCDIPIESAKCRIYRLKANSGSTEAHQKKAENQQELMEITIKALEFYRDEYE